MDAKGNVIYVGKAKNLKNRISSYFGTKLGGKTSALVSQISDIKTIKVESEVESLLLEAKLIQKHFPKYNVRFADNKAYPVIRITIKDKYPKVLVARAMTDVKSIYFGPFPNTQAMRTVLKIARRIFPFQSVLNHPNRLCLYYHLGLCTCPEVTKDESYRKNILHLIDFLKGNTKKVVRELEKERTSLSKNEEYEKANQIQRKLEAINLVTSPFYKPFEYEENPNLHSDIRNEELEMLKKTLEENGVLTKTLKRIECIDISIISGKFATGSLVVFTNGEKDSSWYRRFRIRRDFGKNNDFAMMEEVLKRRFNHPEWPLPDLLVVDGGKGQVSTASQVLESIGLNIPLVGLAKREETIITPDFKEVRLPKDSKALHLVMRIRDEAHRFAITYHRKLRSKFLIG
ncbi:MAG TPA: excinuclease ABC subunit UvrC [Patescibacteria group bacterium]|nr:excinuclease ABC subunit UvrC [Patescibacteria group bacterium]